MPKLYSVSVSPTSMLPVDTTQVEKVLSGLGDWIRFSPWQWYLLSSEAKEKIGTEVWKKLNPADQIIVLVVQPEYGQGRASNWIWEWLNDRMQKSLASP